MTFWMVRIPSHPCIICPSLAQVPETQQGVLNVAFKCCSFKLYIWQPRIKFPISQWQMPHAYIPLQAIFFCLKLGEFRSLEGSMEACAVSTLCSLCSCIHHPLPFFFYLWETWPTPRKCQWLDTQWVQCLNTADSGEPEQAEGTMVGVVFPSLSLVPLPAWKPF